jgi:ribonuclease-3
MPETKFEMTVREFLAKPPFGYRRLSEVHLELFCAALTHDSYTNEAKAKAVPERAPSYERLEFLGDAILEMIVCDHVYSNTELAEGHMTDFKQEYVDNEKLSDRIVAYGLDIDGAMRVGKVQIKDGRKDVQVKMRADAFEALVAATYVSKGLDEARRIVSEVLELAMR